MYLHGSDPTTEPTEYVRPIEDLLVDDFRWCAYDRPNVGRSDPVEGIAWPQNMVADLDGVLDAIGAKKPVILLGGLHGGLLADIYARVHPDRVAGIVALDSLFPGLLPLDRYAPSGATFKEHDADDKQNTLEGASSYEFLKYAEARLADQPSIPLYYFAARESWFNTGYGREYHHRVVPALKRYVAGFTPGTLQWVDAGHFMKPLIPDEIARAVRKVAEHTSTWAG